eukprot:Sspe_Gene.67030::Locus_39573_Transcript_1_1_Confidence_1.000_Length_998::g.67030::m.67030
MTQSMLLLLVACVGVAVGQTDLCATVTCTPSTSCHESTCNPATGTCVETVKADGEACNDGNDVTFDDKCTSGTCQGTNPCDTKVCWAKSTCHDAGMCDRTTGECTHPAKPNGTPCNDGNFATTRDQCINGECKGEDLCRDVVCEDLPCHSPGTCNVNTGKCTYPVKPDGTECDDGDEKTTRDQCTAGKCKGVDLCAGKVCWPKDTCHDAGVCDHTTGECKQHPRPNGWPCNDGDGNTGRDQCIDGVCKGSDLCAGKVCTAINDCHTVGVCDPQTGWCSNPVKPDNTTCDDGDAQTAQDKCTAGVCKGVDLCAGVV